MRGVPRKRLSLVHQRQPDTGAVKTTSAPMARTAAASASTVTGRYSPNTHLRRSSRISPREAREGQWRNVLMPENEHVKQLSAARVRLIHDRRVAAKDIADESRRGLNGDRCDALILIQTTIEAIDRSDKCPLEAGRLRPPALIQPRRGAALVSATSDGADVGRRRAPAEVGRAYTNV